MKKRVLIIGATGDVGGGIVRAALQRGWIVGAVGRRPDRLEALASRMDAPAGLRLFPADVSDETGALALARRTGAELGSLDAIVVSVNAPVTQAPLLSRPADDLAGIVSTGLMPHFVVARTFLPQLAENGVYLAIGGGTADAVLPGLGHLSMIQAAQRMMIRVIARECRHLPVHIRELMILSMVNGPSTRTTAPPEWLTDGEIGGHAMAIIADPALFKGPILQLSSRGQAGPSGTAS